MESLIPKNLSLRDKLPVWVIAGATFASGAVSIVQMLVERYSTSPQLFSPLLPFELYSWSRTFTLVFGFILLYLALNLFERRRIAWFITIGISGLAILAHLGHGQAWYTGFVPAVNLFLLFIARKRFTVRSEPRNIVRGIGFLALSILIALIYGAVGLWLMEEREFSLNFHWNDALLHALREIILIGNRDLVPRTQQARWFLDSLHILSVVAGLFGVYSLFRPLAYRLLLLPRERNLARQILDTHGRSSLDFFKLWPDKSYFFSEDESCVIAYRTARNVALCLGDPVGPEDQLEEFTRSFLKWCADNGWAVAFHQALPDLVPMYQRLGLNVRKIGEVGIVDIDHFCTQTITGKHFRSTHNRFIHREYSAMRYVPPHPANLLDAVEVVSNEWLSLPGRRERSFTLGQFSRKYAKETPLFVVRDKEGAILAFASEIPCYPKGDATIDMMRHRLDVPNGTMDFLFSELLLALKEQGYRRFSLGLAPLAGVSSHPGATREEWLTHQLFEHLNRFFSFKGLKSYKDKFDPAWQDRFMVHQGGVPGLLRVVMALQSVTEA